MLLIASKKVLTNSNFNFSTFSEPILPNARRDAYSMSCLYCSTGLTEKANNYYKMFITWTNEKIRKTFVERNMFDFKHIKGFDRR